jgi:hypothetical protein
VCYITVGCYFESGNETFGYIRVKRQEISLVDQQLLASQGLRLWSYLFITRDFSPQANYTDRATRLSVKLGPTSADRGYRVVSATDPHGR